MKIRVVLAMVLALGLAISARAQAPVIPGASYPCTTAGLCFLAGNGGYDFQVSIIPTLSTSARSAGQSLGGLLTFPIAVGNSPQGALQRIYVESKGGSTVQVDIYVWSAKPVNTTCTDAANFVYSQTDEKALVLRTSVTPALVAGGQDTSTSGQATALWGQFANSDVTRNLYVCVLAHASDTPASASDLLIALSGEKRQP